MAGSIINLGGREVGAARPCLIIAEAGVNHDGKVEKAIALIDAARDAGADAVKFQTFRSDKLVSSDAPLAEYQARQVSSVSSQNELISRLELSSGEFRRLFDYCQDRGILFLSTPFDEESADFLVELGVLGLKIGSGELTNSPLLRHVASKKIPLILSTGMGSLGEVETALRIVTEAADDVQVVLLHCLSSYPAPVAEVNLRAIDTLRAAFCVPIGFSDHTLGIDVPLAAVALGACVIEKHITLDKNAPGPDHAASLEPEEFARMASGIRTVEAALGNGIKRCRPSEMDTKRVARRSLTFLQDLPAGAVITPDAIGLRRPATGLPPSMLELIHGRRVRHAVTAGQLVSLDMLE